MTGSLEMSSIHGSIHYKPVTRVAGGTAVKSAQPGVHTPGLVKLRGGSTPGLLPGWSWVWLHSTFIAFARRTWSSFFCLLLLWGFWSASEQQAWGMVAQLCGTVPPVGPTFARDKAVNSCSSVLLFFSPCPFIFGSDLAFLLSLESRVFIVLRVVVLIEVVAC